jgi:Ca2+-dependent lipid-binding protein
MDESGLSRILTLSMDYIPVNVEIEPRERLSNIGQLQVEVLDATDLPLRHRIGYGDLYYCSFKLNGREVFRTGIPGGIPHHPARNKSVVIRSRIAAKFVAHVNDEVFGETDNSLGSTIVDLKRLKPFKPQEYTLPLDGKVGQSGFDFCSHLGTSLGPIFVNECRGNTDL